VVVNVSLTWSMNFASLSTALEGKPV